MDLLREAWHHAAVKIGALGVRCSTEGAQWVAFMTMLNRELLEKRYGPRAAYSVAEHCAASDLTGQSRCRAYGKERTGAHPKLCDTVSQMKLEPNMMMLTSG